MIKNLIENLIENLISIKVIKIMSLLLVGVMYLIPIINILVIDWKYDKNGGISYSLYKENRFAFIFFLSLYYIILITLIIVKFVKFV